MRSFPDLMRDWRTRLIANATLAVAFLFMLDRADAPAWALLLLVFMATRASVFDLLAALYSLKQPVRPISLYPTDAPFDPLAMDREIARERERLRERMGGGNAP